MLAWGQNMEVLGCGSLAGSSNHQAAPSILLPLVGPSEQVAQGRDRGLVTPVQADPQAASWWQAATGTPPAPSTPLVFEAVLFLLILHCFCHINISA